MRGGLIDEDFSDGAVRKRSVRTRDQASVNLARSFPLGYSRLIPCTCIHCACTNYVQVETQKCDLDHSPP